jgi:hypothetical protein
LNPEGDAGSRARTLLGRLEPGRVKTPARASVFIRGGVEVDSNVTLDSGVALAGASTDQSDVRAVWGGGLTIDALRTERTSLSLGYRYNESVYDDLDTHDLQEHLFFTSLRLPGPSQTALRLDALASDVHLAGERYLRSWTLRPNLFVTTGKTLGVSRLWAEVERRDYRDSPLISSLNRDGARYSVGIEQYFRVPGRVGSLASLGFSVSRTNTEASPDVLGFKGDYDNRRARFEGRIQLPLVGPLRLELGSRLSWFRYVNRNLVDSLTDNGVGTMFPSRRRDVIAEATAKLSWAFAESLSMELRWAGTRAYSNVDVFEYKRNIVGLQLIAHRPWL